MQKGLVFIKVLIYIPYSLIQMISGLSGSPIHLNFGGSANPGDYVFSQTGLDNIITQLMEQANR